MDAVFTLPYSEYAAANMLAEHFRPSKGYSVFVPASRAEKGIDLLLAAPGVAGTNTLAFQVKASRTYPGTPAKRAVRNRRFAYYTWFNRFDVPHQADFFMLYGLFPSEQGTGKKVAKSWWQSLCLVFPQKEMANFMKDIKTKSGKPDRMFGFGFDDPAEVFLTRGFETGAQRDCSSFLFEAQLPVIQKALGSSLKMSSNDSVERDRTALVATPDQSSDKTPWRYSAPIRSFASPQFSSGSPRSYWARSYGSRCSAG